MGSAAARARLLSVTITALAVLAGCASNGGGELKTASDVTAAEKRASIRLQLAVGYYQNAQYETALDEVKQAIAADPDNADSYGLRALIYTEMGQLALADERTTRPPCASSRAARTCRTTTVPSCAPR